MIAAAETASSRRIAGSFRDPSGHVIHHRGEIYRAVREDSYQTLQALDKAGLLRELVEDRILVGTGFVDDAELVELLAHEHRGYRHFLKHELIAPITYPYEWSYSMLADAALHTLGLQWALLEQGCSLKDATGYNIQFPDGRPTFIDVTSIERPARLDVWYALGQFGQMFTFPLLLCRYHGWDLRSYFLGHLNGRSCEQVLRSFSWLQRWHPRALLDLTLPNILNRREQRASGTKRQLLERRNSDSTPQRMNLRRLRSKIRRLASGYKPDGLWASYAGTCSYSDPAEQAKKRLVREFLESASPATVLDLGCNTGDYSYIAAECGARVVAADADPDAVDLLYRRLRRQPATITPMVVDLCNPSPAIGFRNEERPSFLGRVSGDCVMALALLHHLHVSGNLPMLAIRDLLHDITRKHLILEFVPVEDPMFQQLMKFRVDLYRSLTLDSCRRVFSERFRVVREESIRGTRRTLMFLRKPD